MAKRVVWFVVQFVCFSGLLLLGGYWDAVRLSLEVKAMQANRAMPAMVPLWKTHFSASHDLIWNGIVFAGVLCVVILLVETLRRRQRPWAGLTLGAYLAGGGGEPGGEGGFAACGWDVAFGGLLRFVAAPGFGGGLGFALEDKHFGWGAGWVGKLKVFSGRHTKQRWVASSEPAGLKNICLRRFERMRVCSLRGKSKPALWRQHGPMMRGSAR